MCSRYQLVLFLTAGQTTDVIFFSRHILANMEVSESVKRCLGVKWQASDVIRTTHPQCSDFNYTRKL